MQKEMHAQIKIERQEKIKSEKECDELEVEFKLLHGESPNKNEDQWKRNSKYFSFDCNFGYVLQTVVTIERLLSSQFLVVIRFN